MSEQPPASVISLAEQRAQARTDRDFAKADDLRDAIADAGWIVTDTAEGFALAPKPPFEVFANLQQLTEQVALGPVDTCVAVIVEGWSQDVMTCFTALTEHVAPGVRILGLDLGNVDGAGEVLAGFAPRVEHLHVAGVSAHWAQAVTALLSVAAADVVVLMDLSTVLTGDAIASLRVALGDGVVAAAWQGVDVDIDDAWRSLVPAGPGEVDAFLGYCVALDRAFALAHPPHPKARFYRNADIEWSFILRAAGGHITVPAGDLPLRQDRHRGYHDADPQLRDRESKRTYDRFLSAFRGRQDLLHPR
jgi:hypothetical protein